MAAPQAVVVMAMMMAMVAMGYSELAAGTAKATDDLAEEVEMVVTRQGHDLLVELQKRGGRRGQ